MSELSRQSQRGLRLDPPPGSTIEPRYNAREVRVAAMMAAGAGAGCVMKFAPDVVMPTEDVAAAVDRVLGDLGVPLDEGTTFDG